MNGLIDIVSTAALSQSRTLFELGLVVVLAWSGSGVLAPSVWP
jgi:hypothetical protein